MAVSSTFNPGNGELTTTGDNLDNMITTSRDAAGSIHINSAAVPIQGGIATVTNTGLIQAFGQDGNDAISLDETNGALPSAKMFGGLGNDTLIGGSAADQLFGEAGNDTLLGKGGIDILSGGDGNDTLTGGTGNDQLFGGAGNDFFFWSPGDGSDTVEGQDGSDALEFAGANISENINISANGERVRFTRDVANVIMDLNDAEGIRFRAFGGADNITIGDLTGTDTIGVVVDLEGALNSGTGDGAADTITVNGSGASNTINVGVASGVIQVVGTSPNVAIFHAEAANDRLVINANGGDDVITAANGLAALTSLTIDGGAGNDTITGGDGADLLLGGDGNDTVTGGRGDDVALLGAGDDRFFWNPGDGSDVVEGQDGVDALEFAGANISENIDISANGGRVRFTRDVANITMDLNDVEGIRFRAFGGADNIVVNDLSGTDTTGVVVDLEGTLNSGTGDGQVDTVTVNSTQGDDAIVIRTASGVIQVVGTTPNVAIFHSEATDRLVINGLGGADVIDASGLAAGQTSLTLNGGLGDDVLIGSQGNDVVFGGDGNDLALLGAGNDSFFWNPGDDNDTVEGQAGSDALEFAGANISENINISANGERVRFTRDVANVTMDLNDVEGIRFRAFGGADNITIGDLTGTDTIGVVVDLEGALNSGTGDGAADTITVNGSGASNTINVGVASGVIQVVGTSPNVAIFHAEAANDRLVINANGGDDVITAANGLAALTSLTIDGGAGNDTITGGDGADLLLGGDGNDTVTGGRGDDVALLGAGDDRFFWNPGDGSDVVEGQDGVDALEFAGANISENIDISANGGRVRFTRDVANITMDLNDVEGIRFRAFGGADNIVVNDLSGTDTTGVVVDLEGTLNSGTGDGQVDTVTVNSTQGDDAIVIRTASGVIQVVGTTPNVAIFHSEATDRLVINGLGGADVIDASGLAAGQTSLTLNGGLGDDVLIGSQGNDVVFGGDGNDLALLGAGNDSFFWNPGDDNDTVEGQAGSDALEFAGANISENINISANGERVRFTRDVANVTMDLNDVEGIRFRAFGGADNITIGDLTGTDTIGVVVDLEGALNSGTGDGAADTITVNGSGASNTINVGVASGVIQVVGTSPNVAIFHAEATDQLVVNGGAGNDTINAATLPPGTIALTLNGGAGNDTLIGSQGNDSVVGGTGNDLAFLGAGDDVFVWNPGDGSDTVEGQAGADTLLFNGANVNETISISANGGRATFTRDVASITMDVDGTETIDFHALGGADTITVDDMTGTDVSKVRIDLAAAGGGGDGQVDTIVINATNGNDAVTIINNNGVVTVSGLAAEVTISGFEATDRIIINGLAGDDVVDGSRLGTAMEFTADGGDGADVLIGSDGADTLKGGAGDDVLIGGPGLDVLDGGPGDNVVIQSVAVGTPGNDIGAGTNHDVIQDFAGDVISLAAADANLNVGGDQAFSFIGTDAFSAAGQLRFFADGAGNTIVEGNVDNNLGADFQIELHNFTGQLHASDFLL